MENNIKYTGLLILLFFNYSVMAQENEELEWKPALTEVWEPEPAKVDPGNDNQPPSDAIVLFDGTNFEHWDSANEGEEVAWQIDNRAMTVSPKTGAIQTKESFGDIQLHIEWRSPEVINGKGQGRGNSGIFLQKRYEIQVLDSYENRTYSNGQAGSIYKQSMPLVNATKKPGEWQTYDIIYTAPVFDENDQLKYPARVTILHNGVLIQNNVMIMGATKYIGLPQYKAHGKAPILLQDHGDPVSFRNIWVRPL